MVFVQFKANLLSFLKKEFHFTTPEINGEENLFFMHVNFAVWRGGQRKLHKINLINQRQKPERSE